MTHHYPRFVALNGGPTHINCERCGVDVGHDPHDIPDPHDPTDSYVVVMCGQCCTDRGCAA